jgi:rare lipoprotein A
LIGESAIALGNVRRMTIGYGRGMQRAHRRPTLAVLAAASLVVVACSSTRAPRAPAPGRDGPGANPPANLAQVPDAEPRLEPLRSGGPNKPYEVFGRTYTPLTNDRPFNERGLASWYGSKFHGRPTSSGEPYDMYAMTAAHKTMPIPSYARVRNPANGREVIVRINDRGPFHAGRVIDLSYTAALKLGVLNAVSPVEVERITQEAIRTGAWRMGTEGRALAAAPAPSVAATTSAPAAPPPVTAPDVPSGAVTNVAIAPPSASTGSAGSADAGPGDASSGDDEVPRGASGCSWARFASAMVRSISSARSNASSIGLRLRSQCSPTATCIACRPGRTARAPTPAARPTACAPSCNWCR